MQLEKTPAEAQEEREESTIALLVALKKVRELVYECCPLKLMNLADVPEKMLREATDDVCAILKLCGEIHAPLAFRIANNELAEIEAEERARRNGAAEPACADARPWVNDSWIAECEAAGVYSRETPAFCYEDKRTLAVALTPSELWTLAQRHLNTVLMHSEYQEWNGDCEQLSSDRAMLHELRFWQLCEQLPSEDQERFRQQIKIRQRYIRSVAAEVLRCEQKEAAFWKRVEAGRVSAAGLAAHVTPPFIRGLPVIPAPADGGPGPDEWDIFSTSYHENTFSDLAHDPNENG